MGEDKSTHILKMRRQRGSESSKHRWRRTKDALARDEGTKGSLRTANTDGGGQKHTHPRGEETKGGQRTTNTWGRTKAHTS